ncbi:hypothetical protein ACS0TY_015355 [Phlomoides rotata]
MEDGGERKGHAIMISVPYQGHINPFVSLALKLASKGFSVTFVHLEFVHHKLSEANSEVDDIFSEARQSGLDIRYTTIGDGFPLEFDREAHFEEYWANIVRDFGGRVDEFLAKLIGSDPDGVRFLVADSIFNWPVGVAEKHKLVNVSFWTQPALVFSIAYHWGLLQDKGHIPCTESMAEEINYIPGVESINTKDLMLYARESDINGIVSIGTRLAFKDVKKADFIIHNTVFELESSTLSALNKYQPNYAIGPITFSKTSTYTPASNSLWSESDCTQWLASKPPGSVMYISFGSLVHTNKQVIEEVAYGLLLSEVNFIWVLRQGILGNDNTSVLPEGFQERTKDKGLIVPWCNQIKVLSDPAVGVFLTHCGWNSTLESIWCGVPMICYPIGFEQFSNRKLVVDDWKIGINLCDGTSINREELSEKVKIMMGSSVSESFREEANKVKAIIHNALETDGSSEINFDRFVKDLEAKIYA